MWKVERNKVVMFRETVPLEIVGVYRWRWLAILVAWFYAHGWWACFVNEVTA
jgi:hypothetical protein